MKSTMIQSEELVVNVLESLQSFAKTSNLTAMLVQAQDFMEDQLEQMVLTRKWMTERMENASQEAQQRLRQMQTQMLIALDRSFFDMLEGIHSTMDQIEGVCGNVLLPPSPEDTKLTGTLDFRSTVKRLLRLSWRFNGGVLQWISDKVYPLIDWNNWMWLVESLYNPQKVQYRFQTIRDEIGRKHVSRDLNKNTDLLYVDKQAIYLGRNVRHGWEIMSGETRRIFDLIMDVNEHFKNRLLQLTDDLKEVRSIQDLTVLWMQQIRTIVQFIKTSKPGYIQDFGALTKLQAWLVKQEKSLKAA